MIQLAFEPVSSSQSEKLPPLVISEYCVCPLAAFEPAAAYSKRGKLYTPELCRPNPTDPKFEFPYVPDLDAAKIPEFKFPIVDPLDAPAFAFPKIIEADPLDAAGELDTSALLVVSPVCAFVHIS